MNQTCTAIIDLSALTHNFKKVRVLAQHSQISAMIKGNAYGHGLLQIARHLKNADGFGLARYAEAITLRQAGVDQRLLMLEGFTDYSQLQLVDRLRLDLVVHDISQIQPLLDFQWNDYIKIWLKIDTGMGRLGMLPEQVRDAWNQLLSSASKLKVEVCMTHFAQAHWVDDSKTIEQITNFNALCHSWPVAKSLANSAGVLYWQAAHQDWVRPGVMLYGVSPLSGPIGSELGLRPVMQLQTVLIAVRAFKKGQFIGYESTYQCPNDMRVGVAAVGYADGYPRYIRAGTPVLVNGVSTKILGQVSMDMVSIDITNIDAKVGDIVTLWGGNGLAVETIAKYANTSPYELLAGLTQRVEYDFVQ